MECCIPAVNWAFLCLVCSIQETVTALGDKFMYARMENKVVGHVFESQIERSAIKCCVACSQLPKCAAVNYFPDTGCCEFNERHPLDQPSSSLILNDMTGVRVYYKTCDQPWVLFDRHCYLFSGSSKTWMNSRDYCRTMDAELVEIHDETEDVFIRNKAIEINAYRMWIGLGFYHTVLPRSWSSGQPITYTNFADGEPNFGSGEEDCIELLYQYQYKWNDAPCYYQLPFTCKKRIYT